MKNNIETNPDFVNEALHGVELSRLIDRRELGVLRDPTGKSYNMLAREIGEDAVELFGIVTPVSLGYQANQLPAFIQNVTDLHELSSDMQHIDRTAKGVGARMYNSAAAVSGWIDGDKPWALYRTTINPNQVFDARHDDNTLTGKTRRIATHAGTFLSVITYGLEYTIDAVHEQYEGAAVVIVGQPPHAAMRQNMRGPGSAPRTFAIIRHASTLTCAGRAVHSHREIWRNL